MARGHDHAGQSGAGLAGVEERLGHTVSNRSSQLCVLQDDVGALAAKLERDTLHGVSGQLADPFAGPSGPGQADQVHVGMGGEGLAHHRAGPGDQIEHPGGQPGMVDDLGQHESVERGHLGRLEDHRAAGRQSGRHLRCDLMQREVPRGDGGHHPDRFPHHQRIADVLLEANRVEQLAHGAERQSWQTRLDDM